MRPIHALLVVLALAACDSPTESVTPVPGDPAVQRQVWEAQGIDDYRYLFSAYSPMAVPVPRMRVDVRDGEVVAAVDARTGERLDRQVWSQALTVAELFDRMAAARASGIDTEMTFHPRLGYPMTARIHRLELDGIVYSIQELRRLD